jgi:hypothetical protein
MQNTARSCETDRLRDLKDEKLAFRTNCEMGDFLLESCRKQGFEPRIVYRSAREDKPRNDAGSNLTEPMFRRTGSAATASPKIQALLAPPNSNARAEAPGGS